MKHVSYHISELESDLQVKGFFNFLYHKGSKREKVERWNSGTVELYNRHSCL